MEIPYNIKYLNLNCNNQNIVENLPNSIVELVLCYDFDLELNNLPTSIKKISIRNPNYNKELNNLPYSLELLELPIQYDKIIINKPPFLNFFFSWQRVG